MKYSVFHRMRNVINPITPAGISHCEAIFHTQSVFHKSRKGFISQKRNSLCLADKGCFFSGTPGETRTHYLALRRRTLYPGELRGHGALLLYPKFWGMSILSQTIFPFRGIYWKECAVKGGKNMWERDADCHDLDDLLFTEDDGGPSER